MSEDSNPKPGHAAGDQRQFQLRVNEQDMARQYANAFRVNTTTDEVLIDLGFNMVSVNRQPNQPADAPAGVVQLDWQHRAIVNYRTAKGLAIELGRIVRAYEERFGEIKPPAQNPGSPGSPEQAS
ncbi:MAG: DUF3467 domain-containing protein [Planctomycetota bacterium]